MKELKSATFIDDNVNDVIIDKSNFCKDSIKNTLDTYVKECLIENKNIINDVNIINDNVSNNIKRKPLYKNNIKNNTFHKTHNENKSNENDKLNNSFTENTDKISKKNKSSNKSIEKVIKRQLYVSNTLRNNSYNYVENKVKYFVGQDSLANKTIKDNVSTSIKVKSTLNKTTNYLSLAKRQKKMRKQRKNTYKINKGLYKLISNFTSKIINNPIVIKGLFIIFIVVLLVLLCITIVNSFLSVFIATTTSTTGNDGVLNDIHLYVTEKDTDYTIDLINNGKLIYKNNILTLPADIYKTDGRKIYNYLTAKLGVYEFDINIKNEINYIYNLIYEKQETDILINFNVSNIKNIIIENKLLNDTEYFDVLNNNEIIVKDEIGNPFIGYDIKKYISSRYGYRINPLSGEKEMHTGIDIPKELDTPINAVMDGVVSYVGYDENGYGNYFIVENGKNKTLYAHCSKVEVKINQRIKHGDIIAYVGSTGMSTGSHLHLEYFKNNLRVNPIDYFFKEK
ncbi:MAG: M23 family metallopeptidase [Oscillospiraceae bacterium]